MLPPPHLLQIPIPWLLIAAPSVTPLVLELLFETLLVSQAPALRAIASYGQPFLTHRRFLEECHPPMLWFVPFGHSQPIHGFQWGIATHCPRPRGGRGRSAKRGRGGGYRCPGVR